MDRDSKSRAAKHILITVASQAWKLSAGFVLTIFSTRNLTPSDFGVLAMVGTLTTLFGVAKDFGVGQAIVQSTSITKGQIDALFWLSVLASAASALFLALSAYPISLFYDDSRLRELTLASAAVSFIAGLPTVPAALLTRQSRFRTLATVDIATTTASVLAGIVAVTILRNYWALYVFGLVWTLASTIGIWSCSSYRPGYPHIDSETLQLARFGFQVSGFNLVSYFSRNSDNILIGRFRGGEELGLYDRAYRLLLLPITQLHNPIGQVMVPLLSRLRSENEKYLSVYNDTLSLVLLICQPGIIFAVLLPEPLFGIVLGDRWVAAAPIFSCLGLASLIQVATATAGWLFLSQERGREFFRLGVWSALINVASFVVGLPWGALGVAMAYALANYAFLLPLYAILIGRNGPVTTKDLIKTTTPHWLACFVAAATAKISMVYLPSGTSLIGLATILGLSYFSYVIAVLSFAHKRILARRVLRYAYDRTAVQTGRSSLPD